MDNKARPILSELTPEDHSFVLGRLDRFVDRSGGPEACWPWTKALKFGYGVTHTSTSGKRRRLVATHRLSYEVATGESPPSVDHLCHDSAECRLGVKCPHRRCCNPAHLAAASVGDNARRAKLGVYRLIDMCGKSLHAMTPENTYEVPGGGRRCRACAAEAAQARRAEAAASRPAASPSAREYRPRGMSLEQLVAWGLEGQDDAERCWYWRGKSANQQGYMTISIGKRTVSAHRLVCQVRNGEFPTEWDVDHLCHDPQTCSGGLTCPHRACVNPAHLAAVPHTVNLSAPRSARHRPTHCHEGHEFTEANTRRDSSGRRHCQTCRADRQRESRAAAPAKPDGRARKGNLCRNNHDVTVVGVRAGGKCAECAREAQRKYKAGLSA